MDTAPQSVIKNIDDVVSFEEELTARRGLGERVGEAVGSFAGRLAFVACQLAVVAGWVVVNAGLVPGVPAFDPFPYGLGGAMLSLEGVLLASFVLLKQAHEGRLSERRSHLNLQANLLVEKEVTKLIQMLQLQSRADGTERQVMDGEAREMAQNTAVGHLAKELDRRLDPD
ncbi:MAG: DUF1003 domain-containing protein [Janthinobacterium lividum]